MTITRKFLTRTLTAAIGVIVVATTLLCLLVGSESGSRWALRSALKLSDDQIAVGRVRGRLWDGIELTDVRIDSAIIVGHVKRFSFRWQPRALLGREFLITEALIDAPNVQITQQTSPSNEPLALQLPALPVTLQLEHLGIRDLQIRQGERSTVIDQVGIAGTWDAERITVNRLTITSEGHSLNANGSIPTGLKPHIVMTANWRGPIGDTPSRATMNVDGLLSELGFKSTFSGVVSAQLVGHTNLQLDTPTVDMHGAIEIPAESNEVALSGTEIRVVGPLDQLHIVVNSNVSSPRTGKFRFSLDGDINSGAATDDRVEADFRWRTNSDGAQDATLTGTGRITYSDSIANIEHTTTAPYRSRISGDVLLTSLEPALDLDISLRDINFQLDPKNAITAHTANAQLKGPISDLALSLISDAGLPIIGKTTVATRAQFTDQQLRLDEFNATLLNGVIAITDGVFDFANGGTGALHFDAHDLDLTNLNPQTPSRLDFSGRATFGENAAGPFSELDLTKIGGYLRGHEVGGDARVVMGGGAIAVQQANLIAGDNYIKLIAELADNLSGSVDIAMNDLSVFDARLAGRINGHGDFSGPPDSPTLSGQLSGRDLRFDDSTVDHAIVDLEIDPASAARSNITLALKGISVTGESYGNLELDADGTAAAHSVRADLNGKSLSGNAAATGSFSEGIWRGTLTVLQASAPTVGTWTLVSPSDTSISDKTIFLEKSCLNSGAANACVALDHAANDSTANLELNSVPLKLLDGFLPNNLRISGVTNGDVALRRRSDVITGSGKLNISAGMLERGNPIDSPEKFAIDNFSLDFDIEPEGLNGRLSAKVAQWLSVDGELRTARTQQRAISGKFNARIEDVARVAEFIPELAGSTGILEITSNVGGTIKDPTGQVLIRLASGAFRLPDLGLKLTNVNAELDGNAQAIAVSAALGTGAAALSLQGNLKQPIGNQWVFESKINGENFPILRTPEAEIDISPTLVIAAKPNDVRITGDVLVPKVLIDIKTLPPSAIKVSEDQIIVAADGSVPKAQTNQNSFTDIVSGDIDVRLGDEISVGGFGLDSKLSGGLTWAKRRGNALARANGKIVIEEGVFQAYGQNMEIENGRLQFAGPIDNPGLDLQAVRPDLDIRAGVDVSGSVRTPVIELFSEPALSDANILSYIVTGRSLDDTSAGDEALLTQAALSLGIEKSAAATNELKNTFGLDELSIAGGESVQDTSLVAGKKLSPKLSVRTAFNPFDQLWSFFLNYKLTERWSIEAESGERQGADLLYRIERDILFGP